MQAAETGEGALAPAASRQCEECEKVSAEIVCEECKASYCKECCKSTHEDLGWDHAFNCSFTPIMFPVPKQIPELPKAMTNRLQCGLGGEGRYHYHRPRPDYLWRWRWRCQCSYLTGPGCGTTDAAVCDAARSSQLAGLSMFQFQMQIADAQQCGCADANAGLYGLFLLLVLVLLLTDV